MRPMLILGMIGFGLVRSATAQEPAKKPDLAAEKPASTASKLEARVAELLDPGSVFPKFGLRKEAREWAGPAAVDDPHLAIPRHLNGPIKPGGWRKTEFAPRFVPGLAPLSGYRATPATPAPLAFPVEPLIRLITVDANETPPLPILATPLADRASLADPTAEVSLQTLVPTLRPARSGPVPFSPVNLPDPFENERTGRLSSLPEESSPPAVMQVRRALR